MIANGPRRSAQAAIAVAMAALLAMSDNAMAACFEGIGCTDDHAISKGELRALSCDALWTVRNFIYDEKGYCFQTAKAQAVFSNDGCFIASAAQVPLNAYERTNIDRIVSVEREKGC